jgi:hypothetical protein
LITARGNESWMNRNPNKGLRAVRELILKLLGLTIADQLPVRVRKELQNVVQLLQVYGR